MKKILIVDDDMAMGEMCKELLKVRGMLLMPSHMVKMLLKRYP